VHRLAFQADEDRDGVAMLFDSDALSPDVIEVRANDQDRLAVAASEASPDIFFQR
jgi:hypothetical protein